MSRSSGALAQLGWILGGVLSLLVMTAGLLLLGAQFGTARPRYEAWHFAVVIAGIAGGAACLTRLLRYQREGREHVEAIDRRRAQDSARGFGTFDGNRFEANLGGLRYFFAALGMPVLLAIPVLCVIAPEKFTVFERWVMPPLALGSALALGWYLRRMRPRGRSLLVLDENGIDHRLYGAVRWQDVQSMQLDTHAGRMGRHSQLFLRLLPGLPSQGTARQWLGRSFPPALGIYLTGLDQPPERILQAARVLWERARPGFPPHHPEARLEQAMLPLAEMAERNAGQDEIESYLRALGERNEDPVVQAYQEAEARRRRLEKHFAGAFLAALLLLGIAFLVVNLLP